MIFLALLHAAEAAQREINAWQPTGLTAFDEETLGDLELSAEIANDALRAEVERALGLPGAMNRLAAVLPHEMGR